MQLLNAFSFFTGPLTQVMCWTLLHSLWQALLLAAIAGIIVMATKKATASLRYNLLSIVFILFVLTVGFTFIQQLRFVTNPISDHADIDTLKGNSLLIINTNVLSLSQQSVIERVVLFFNNNATWIVLCWIVFIVIRSVRLCIGLNTMRRFRTTGVGPVNEYWNQRLYQLSQQLNINKRIAFLQSAIVKIPMVIGHFKPLILFPVGIINALPEHEVEAILLHELAHIKRKDFLMNMLQHFVEVLFCFNPALLWVSSLIRQERENCCDDIAITGTNNKRNYINALVSFQEYHLADATYANAFSNGKDHLLQRVKRIIHNNNKTLNGMEKTLLLLGFISTATLSIVFSQTAKNKSGQLNEHAPVVRQVIDTVPERQQESAMIYADTTISNENGLTIKQGVKINGDTRTYYSNGFEIVTEKNNISSVLKNGKQLSSAEINSKREMLKDIIAKLNKKTEEQQQVAMLNKIMAEKMAQQAEQNASIAMNEDLTAKALDEQQVTSQQQKLEVEQATIQMLKKIERETQELTKSEDPLSKKQKETQQRLYELQAKLAAQEDKHAAKNDDYAKVQELYAKKKAEMEVLTELNKMKEKELAAKDYDKNNYEILAKKQQLEAEQYRLQSQIAAEYAQKDKVKAEIKSAVFESFIKDLKIDGLIKEGKASSIQLNSEALIIDGVKQSNELYKKYKAKYGKDNDWNVTYSRGEQ